MENSTVIINIFFTPSLYLGLQLISIVMILACFEAYLERFLVELGILKNDHNITVGGGGGALNKCFRCRGFDH